MFWPGVTEHDNHPSYSTFYSAVCSVVCWRSQCVSFVDSGASQRARCSWVSTVESVNGPLLAACSPRQQSQRPCSPRPTVPEQQSPSNSPRPTVPEQQSKTREKYSFCSVHNMHTMILLDAMASCQAHTVPRWVMAAMARWKCCVTACLI